MRIIKRNIYIILLLFFVSAILLGDEAILKSWKTPDGLPQDSILAMAQSSDGYLWLGTGAGLVRFDGVKFRVFSHWNTPAMASDKVTSLLVDRNNALWAGLDGGGVARLHKNQWSSLTTGDGLSHLSVTSLHEDRDGNLWIGTLYGVNRLRNGQIESFTSGDGLPGNMVQALGESPDGALLVGTLANGLAEFSNEAFSVPQHLKLCSHQSIISIRFDGNATTWIGGDNGLLFLKNKSLSPLEDAGNRLGTVRSLYFSSGDNLLVGTDGNGVFTVDSSGLGFAPIVDQLSDHFIYALFEDREMGFWLGTFTDGLFRVKEKKVGHWLADHGAKDRLVNTVLVDKANFCWVGTQKGGLLKLKEGEVVGRFMKGSGLDGNNVRALFEDGPGVIWGGTSSGGVVVLEDNRVISSFRLSTGAIGDSVNVFFKDRIGTLWIGTNRGLTSVSNNKLDVERLLPERSIKVMGDDSKGTLWAGTDRGLFYFKDDRFIQMESDSRLLTADIMSFHLDRQGRTWIGTNGDGLFSIHDKTIRRFTKAEGLRDDFIYSIQEDARQRLWMSSGQGVFFVPLSDLATLTGGNRTMVRCYSLDEEDGMASRQCSGGFMPSSWMTATGHILFPTIRGITVLDPDRMSINTIAPNVVVEEVLADNEIIQDFESIRLQEDTRVMEFYFTAISFTDPGDVRFKYKLEGFDTEWTNLSPRQPRAAMYINLEPGEYRFRVLAANSDGVWNEEGAGVRFRIGSGFPVFPIVLLALLLGMSVFFIAYRRSGQEKDTTATAKKYSTSALTEDRALNIQKRLMDLMEKDNIYLDPDLTLKKLSEKLQVHPNYLSQIINETLGQRSSDFINRYRIEYVKIKLRDQQENHKTILDIALESGFYSKSVFNTAFKKFTGTTPSKFRKK